MPRPFSFLKENRIKKKLEFQNIYQTGKKVNGRYYAVYFLPSDGRPRIGIAVPKRLGNAVFRNRQKRVLREFFRHRKESFQHLKTVFVLIRKPAGKPEQAADLERIVKWLSKAN